MADATVYREPDPSLITVTQVTYALHALGLAIGAFGASTIVGSFVFGWPSIIAVIINYVKRGEARGTWLESHFTWQIRTFWFAMLWACLIFFAGLAAGDCPGGLRHLDRRALHPRHLGHLPHCQRVDAAAEPAADVCVSAGTAQGQRGEGDASKRRRGRRRDCGSFMARVGEQSRARAVDERDHRAAEFDRGLSRADRRQDTQPCHGGCSSARRAAPRTRWCQPHARTESFNQLQSGRIRMSTHRLPAVAVCDVPRPRQPTSWRPSASDPLRLHGSPPARSCGRWPADRGDRWASRSSLHVLSVRRGTYTGIVIGPAAP